MAIGYLNERTKNLITMVLKGSNVLSIKEIAAQMAVSTRTIYNEIEKANSWLTMKKLPLLQVVRGKVQLFSDEEKNLLEEAMELEQPSDYYVFTPTERVRMIICQIIISRNPVYIEDLMNSCFVSRNTIFTDLQVVISQLQTYQLELRYEKRRGYWIEGDVIRTRAIFFLYFNMLEPLFTSGKLSFLHTEEIEPYLEQIEQVEEELHVNYVKNDKIALAAMISIMTGNEEELHFFSGVDERKIQESREYQLVTKYFSKLPEQEKIYLTVHFLGGRLESYSTTEDGSPNEFIMEISKNLVVEFQRQACVIFRKKEELIQNLYQHIKSSIYRYWYGIQIGNPMVDDIKREYPYIFEVMRATVRYLEQQIGVQISDSEVSYLALHFGSHLEFADHDEKELRILVVCMNGVATGNMISHELSRILPQAKVVGVKAASELVNPQDICDIIISSVKIKTVVPVIVVNSILNDFDRNNILNHPLIRSRFGFVDVEALFQLVKKYVPKDRYKELRNDLEGFFTHSREEKQPVLNPEVWRLMDFLTEDRIVFLNADGIRRGDEMSKVEREMSVWERALYTVARPLIKRKSIEKLYVEKMIERLKEAGPYMFVTKDLIIAHSHPDHGVNHLDLSIGIIEGGIPFENEKVARIIICLAAEDQQKHMGVLRDIRKAVAKRKQVDELVKAEDPEQICEILRSRLANI